MTSALIAAVVLSASSANELRLASIDEAPRPTRAIVTTAPVATGLMLSSTALTRFMYNAVWLPVDVAVPLDEHRTLDVDVGLALALNGITGRVGWSVSASVGPTWYFGDAPHSGFYLGPRFMLQLSRSAGGFGIAASSGASPLDLGPDIGRAFTVGGELGYLFHVGALVMGPVFGASVGYAFDQREPLITPFRTDSSGRLRPDTFGFALNLNLFRFGVAF